MISKTLSDIETRISTRNILLKKERQTLSQLEEVSVALLGELEEIGKAINLCDLCLKEQTDIKSYIEDVVTALLQAVHGDSYAFQFEVVYQKDGKKDSKTVSGLKPQISEFGVWDDYDEYG